MSDGDHGQTAEPATSVTLELTAPVGGTALQLVHQGIPPGSPGRLAAPESSTLP